MLVSPEQAVANALASFLTGLVDPADPARLAKLFQGIGIEPRWPEANVPPKPKEMTIILAGERETEWIEPVLYKKVRDISDTSALYTWRLASCRQPMQIDVWATSDLARDDIVQRLSPALNLGASLLPGVEPQDPVWPGTAIAVGDGWDILADCLFAAPSYNDAPDAVQRSEYRATFRGEARFPLHQNAVSGKMARIGLLMRLRESSLEQASDPTATPDEILITTADGHVTYTPGT